MWTAAQIEDYIGKTGEIAKDFPGGIKGAAAIIASSLVFLHYGWKYLALNKTKKKIRRRAAKAKESIEHLRKRLEVKAKEIDLRITQLPFKELQSKLRSGELKCVQVLLAFQAKALSLHDELNCVTGFIADAEDRARQLDSLPPSHRGPLHGIPVSLKEVVGVAGEDCTSGLSFFIDKILDDYGTTVKVMMEQGAIPFARTNISQAQISYSCSNPLFGESRNPWDPSRTSGGSSGGEGCLIGGGGSILGIACDMGGSIRIPSHFCGNCGLKPTADRLSGAGNLPFGHGIVTIGEIFGPMGRDVDTLVTMMKATLVPTMFKLDPLLPQLPWREELYTSSKPMRIGFYVSDGGLEPVPAVRRAVLLAKLALETMGHTVVEFSPGDAVGAVARFGLGAIFSDDGEQFKAVMKDEVIDPTITGTMAMPSIPHVIKAFLSKVLFFLHPVEKAIMTIKPCGNVYNWWLLNEAIEEYRREFLSSMQNKNLDALICPTFPVPAWHIRDDTHAFTCGTYTLLYNLLNLPAGVIPVTRVSTDDVKKMDTYPKKYMAEKFVHRLSKGSENLPISVQAVSYPFKEEVTLRVLKEIEKGLQKRGQTFA